MLGKLIASAVFCQVSLAAGQSWWAAWDLRPHRQIEEVCRRLWGGEFLVIEGAGTRDSSWKLLAHLRFWRWRKQTKFWGDQAVQLRTSKVFGSERPLVVFYWASRNRPRKKVESKQLQVQVEQNYWITDTTQKLPQRENQAYMQMWDKLRGMDFSLFAAWFTVNVWRIWSGLNLSILIPRPLMKFSK